MCCVFLQAHTHRNELYYSTPMDHLMWPRRWSLIKDEIEHYLVRPGWHALHAQQSSCSLAGLPSVLSWDVDKNLSAL